VRLDKPSSGRYRLQAKQATCSTANGLLKIADQEVTLAAASPASPTAVLNEMRPQESPKVPADSVQPNRLQVPGNRSKAIDAASVIDWAHARRSRLHAVAGGHQRAAGPQDSERGTFSPRHRS